MPRTLPVNKPIKKTKTASLSKSRASSDGKSTHKRDKAPEKPDFNSTIDNYVNRATAHPENFLLPNKKSKESTLQVIKELYDKNAENSELHTEGFDVEQLWSQIKMQNDPLLTSLEKETEDVIQTSKDEDQFFSVEEMEKFMEGEMNDEDIELDTDEEASSDDEENDLNFEKEGPTMDHELDEDELDEDDINGGLNGDLDDEDDLKLEGDVDDDDVDDDDKTSKNNKIMYKDFFDPPDQKSLIKDREFETPFERHQEKLKKKIEKLEAENIAEKDWTLSGEVDARSRPIGSLLEVDVEYENLSKKPEMMITEETNRTLEDIIKKRICEESWDDVVRKIEKPPPKKAKLELDHEKSKRSLSEIYEQDFMKDKMGIDVDAKKLSEKHQKIISKFEKLSYMLDALSNFNFTPKLTTEQPLSLKVNVPSVRMEEVLPVSVSTATTLAPEQVFEKPEKPKKGETELTQEDRKKYRREVKKKVQKENKEKEAKRKILKKDNPNAFKPTQKEVSSIFANKNVKAGAQVHTEDFTKSKKFFSKLQDEANSVGKPAKADEKPKKDPFALKLNT